MPSLSFAKKFLIANTNAKNSTRVFKIAIGALLVSSLVAEAGVIRGAGRSGRTIIESIQFAGTTPFLIADPVNADDVVGADLATAASYGFGPIGLQASVSHDWGRDCALITECVFELGSSEVFEWQGNLIGLPSQLETGAYDAVADLRVTWELLAIEAPPPDIFTTGPLPTRSLGPDFIWSSLYSASNDGSFTPGIVDPATMLGESLGYLPGPDEFSGCFSPAPSNGAPTFPPLLTVSEAYTYNDCREIGLDLNQDPGQFTGADLNAELVGREYLGLVITTELLAPNGFQFASFYGDGGDILLDATLPGANVLSADQLRGLDSLNYAGCIGPVDDNCQRFVTSSDVMRINVVSDVPAPATTLLLLTGLGLLRRRMRK